MCPVMPGIFEDEEYGDLVRHRDERGERNVGAHTKVLSHWMKEPDLRELDSEMDQKYKLGAIPLLCDGGDLLLQRLSAAVQCRFR